MKLRCGIGTTIIIITCSVANAAQLCRILQRKQHVTLQLWLQLLACLDKHLKYGQRRERYYYDRVVPQKNNYDRQVPHAIRIL